MLVWVFVHVSEVRDLWFVESTENYCRGSENKLFSNVPRLAVTISESMESAISSGSMAPSGIPIGARRRVNCSSVTPISRKAASRLADVLARTKHPDITRRACKRGLQGRVVQFFIVTERGDVGVFVGAEFFQCFGEPFRDEFIRVRKSLPRGKRFARIDDDRINPSVLASVTSGMAICTAPITIRRAGDGRTSTKTEASPNRFQFDSFLPICWCDHCAASASSTELPKLPNVFPLDQIIILFPSPFPSMSVATATS
jgi:hypothetical protein